MSRPFVLYLPQPLRADDRVAIRGRLRNNAKRISFNFIVDDNPNYIALHFKTIFDEDTPPGQAVVFNYKNLDWKTEEFQENTWQLEGSLEFHFVFHFQDDSIRIYTGQDNNNPNSFIHAFRHRLPMERITTIEIWDDLETVKELNMR